MSTAHHHLLSVAETAGAVRAVEVGATFFTGVEVDVAAALVDAVEGPAERLASRSSLPFRPSRANRRRGDGSFYAVDGPDHGTEVVPRTLATLDPDWVLTSCDATGAPPGWSLASAECDVHDYGVAMVVLRWEPDASSTTALASLEAVLADLTAASRSATEAVVRQVATEVQKALRDDDALIDVAPGLNLAEVAVLPPVGEVLWLWHLVLVACAERRAEVVRDIAAVVCPNGATMLEHRDHTLAAGVHVSVAGSAPGKEADTRFLSMAPRAQDAWWALFWRLDRVLLALQLRLEASLATHQLDELQSRAEILHEVSSRVLLLRSRLDSFLVASGARDLDAWHAVSTAWSLEFRLACVDTKMSMLAESYGEAVARISTSRSARVNFMIYVFTAFSVVASALAIAQFAQGPADTGAAVRIATLAASALGAALAVFFSIRVSRAARRRPRLP